MVLETDQACPQERMNPPESELETFKYEKLDIFKYCETVEGHWLSEYIRHT